MNQLRNDRLIKALLRQPVDATPVWIMRQAGRYLPEYRHIRQENKDFIALYRSPELACEITMQPLERFDLDAAILFSDILTIPDAMGLGLYFSPGEGPHFRHPVRTAADIEALPLPHASDFDYIKNAISLILAELNHRIPLIGFAGSPWTLATYMVEGGPSKDFRIIKNMLYSKPELMHQLLAKITRATIDYLNLQIAAGVHAVQIFDTWGGVLNEPAYQAFSLQYMQQIINGLTRERDGQPIPVIIFTKNGGHWLEAMAHVGANCVGLDWAVNISQARQRIGNQVALQGNMEPALLYATDAIIREEAGNILSQFGHGPGHVFNLGHGINRDVNPDKVNVLVDAVHELSMPYHQ